MSPYSNLVFEGGGVKGVAYAGVICALDDLGVLDGILQVAGTSAGAITATLLSLNYSAYDISAIVQSLHFKAFQDGWDPLRFITTYGLYTGDTFLNWIRYYIEQKTGNPDITFKQFNDALEVSPEKQFRKLFVYATNLNTNYTQRFSADDTPDVIVAEAVRASMSIPLFFKAWKFSQTGNARFQGHIFVDGGVLLNYPIHCFDVQGQVENEKGEEIKTWNRSNATLGFRFKDLTEKCIVPNHLGFDEPFNYCKNLFETILNAQVVDFNEDPEDHRRSVQIDDMNIMATDFDITEAQKECLYHNGYHSTVCFLESDYSRIKERVSAVRSTSLLDCTCQPCQTCPPCQQIAPIK